MVGNDSLEVVPNFEKPETWPAGCLKMTERYIACGWFIACCTVASKIETTKILLWTT